MKSLSVPALLLVMLTGACASGELMPASAPTSRAPGIRIPELERAPDASTLAWENAGRRALRSGLFVGPSFRELIGFPDAEPHAVAWRFALRRGQSLQVRVEPLSAHAPLSLELFEVVTDQMYRPEPAPAAARGASTFVAADNGVYVLRLQPPPGSGGIFAVTVNGQQPLLFPVTGSTAASIRSWFGDPRDGGARGHEGVDIFAPRGTPALAVANGTVTSTRPTPAGGNVVWIDDDDGGVSYYYAHLDERRVREGQRVVAGDTIGTVGNTGNARGVSPHLHFSIYLPGRIAVDPAPLLESATPLGEPAIDPALLGRWTRSLGDDVRLRAAPSLAAAVLAALRDRTPLLVLGGVGDWHRVVLRDGTTGFIAARFTEQVQDDGR